MVEFSLPYEVPIRGRGYFRRFFYRMGSDIYVGTVNRTHADIAEEDGNLTTVLRLLRRSSPDGDAGSLQIHIPNLAVTAHGDSTTLEVENDVRSEARRRTGLWLARRFPESYTIEASVPNMTPVTVFSERGRL